MQSEKEFLEGFSERFEECFGFLTDSRQGSKVDYPLIEVIFLAIVAVAGGAFSWEMIEAFGKAHLNVLREYYPFKNGAPSDDTLRRVFSIIDPEQMNEVLMKYFTGNSTNEHIAIDGKSLRGSKRNGTKALHFLNVYAVGSGITLFGKVVDAKTNEITAIPEALDILDIRGSTVTIDAIGCQKNIAARIIERGADYIFGLKENQVALYHEVDQAFSTNASRFFGMDTATKLETGHGRIEERRCRIIKDLAKITKAKDWARISSVIEIKRKVTTKDKTTESTNYYISSSSMEATEMMETIRSHWKIESMHWVMDVVFKEDASSMYKGNIPANMAIIRRFILNILTNMKSKRETRPTLMRMIGWSPDYLHRFIKILIDS